MPRILIAFDKFKDALTAQTAGRIAQAAIAENHPHWPVESRPLSDGGEGFAAILTEAAGGALRAVKVTGPREKAVTAEYGLVKWSSIPEAARAQLNLNQSFSPEAKVAVIEMASASGLALLPLEGRNPWLATTRGTGELMRATVDAGACAIIVGVGGSATNDLGLGALEALGLAFRETAGGEPVLPVPENWEKIRVLAGGIPPSFPPVYIACDVTNPLLGARGAAAAYGPQKGLLPQDLERLEHQSERLARLLCDYFKQPASLMNEPGAGAAGGIAFGLMVALRAQLLPGFGFVSAWLDLDRKISGADLVITGEGRFDASSLEGKGPGAVAARALELGKDVHVFAGQVSAGARERLELHAITPEGTPLPTALREAPENLAATVRRVFARTP